MMKMMHNNPINYKTALEKVNMAIHTKVLQVASSDGQAQLNAAQLFYLLKLREELEKQVPKSETETSQEHSAQTKKK